jgi:hypothetical protein
MSYLAYATEENPEHLVDISHHIAVIDWGWDFVLLRMLSSEGRSLLVDFCQADVPIMLVHGRKGNTPGAPAHKAKFKLDESIECSYIPATVRLNTTGEQVKGIF